MAGSAGAASFGAFFVLGRLRQPARKKAAHPPPRAAAVPASYGRLLPSSANTGDLAILNYALTLEYLETEFLRQGRLSGAVQRARSGALIKDFGQQEMTHVKRSKALLKSLVETPVAKPEGKFSVHECRPGRGAGLPPWRISAASAYLGQAANIKEPRSVWPRRSRSHTVEARHAATLGNAGQKVPSPRMARSPSRADMSTVLAAVKPFLA